jgi:hypothetical protein
VQCPSKYAFSSVVGVGANEDKEDDFTDDDGEVAATNSNSAAVVEVRSARLFVSLSNYTKYNSNRGMRMFPLVRRSEKGVIRKFFWSSRLVKEQSICL